MVPSAGRGIPTSICMVVVLPAPFGPSNPTILPLGTVKLTLSTARNEPYSLVRFWTSRAGCTLKERTLMSTIAAEQRVRVGSVAELRARGCTVISAGGLGVAVFAHKGGASAVENRCPHTGSPLSRGTVRDGLLTCHWHHARFDLEGGGTLDPFADNVRSFPVLVDADDVFIVLDDDSGAEKDGHWLSRLNE